MADSPFLDAALSHPVSRRGFLAAAGATALVPDRWLRAEDKPVPRKKVAAVFTEFRYRSHAHNIIENFLEPYYFSGQLIAPAFEIVAFYADQFPETDTARSVARDYGIPIFDSIDKALCVGGRELAVDAVLSIAEHGEYPLNDLGQTEYPRKRFFDECVTVMRRAGRAVPLFNDKHLAYRWDWAKEMYDTARELGLPLMSGSSVPLAQRLPPLDIPAGAEFTEAVALHGGLVESYDFHGLEVLQSYVESRPGGETGVSRVQFVTGEALRKAADEGRWSPELMEAAIAAEMAARPGTTRESFGEPSHALLIEYKDGFRAAVLKVGLNPVRWSFACRLKGEAAPRATYHYPGPWNNRSLFRALAHAIQVHFTEGRSPYPVERTLLTTGILDATMHSRHAGEKLLETPHLEFAYQPRDFARVRESGASWKFVCEDALQPRGIKRDGPPK